MQLNEIIEKLNASQENVERSSFETINQHDKVANLIKSLTVELDEMMSKLEAMNYTLEDTILTMQETYPAQDLSKLNEFSDMLEEQGLHLIDVSQLIQGLMEEEAIENDVIHTMENEIAQHRDELEQMIRIHNE